MKLEYKYKQLLLCAVCATLVYISLTNLESILAYAGTVYTVLKPFIYGAVMAFVINVPMRKAEGMLSKAGLKKSKRIVAYLITLIIILAAINLFFLIVMPQLIQTLGVLAAKLERFINTIPALLEQNRETLGFLFSYLESSQINWNEWIAKISEGLQNFAFSLIGGGAGFLTGFVGGFTNFILSFIFSVYLVMGKEKICAAAKNVVLAFFSHDSAQRIFYIAGLCNKTFSGFLSGQCLEAVILGVLFVIAMTVFGFPYAVLVGTVIAVTALIPVFGAFVGAGVGIFLIAMEDPIQAVWFLIMFLIIQQIENNLIYPHVVGSSVGLPSLLVFMSVIIGGSLMGVWGMLLFIPSASVLYTLASESVKKRIEKEQIPTDKGFDCSPEKEENRQDNVKENLSPQPAPPRHTEN